MLRGWIVSSSLLGVRKTETILRGCPHGGDIYLHFSRTFFWTSNDGVYVQAYVGRHGSSGSGKFATILAELLTGTLGKMNSRWCNQVELIVNP